MILTNIREKPAKSRFFLNENDVSNLSMDLLSSVYFVAIVARVTDVTAKKQKSLGNARTCARTRENDTSEHMNVSITLSGNTKNKMPTRK